MDILIVVLSAMFVILTVKAVGAKIRQVTSLYRESKQAVEMPTEPCNTSTFVELKTGAMVEVNDCNECGGYIIAVPGSEVDWWCKRCGWVNQHGVKNV